MTMNQLDQAINEMVHRNSEKHVIDRLSEWYEADKINRVQYSYALRSVNLYFSLKDRQ